MLNSPGFILCVRVYNSNQEFCCSVMVGNQCTSAVGKRLSASQGWWKVLKDAYKHAALENQYTVHPFLYVRELLNEWIKPWCMFLRECWMYVKVKPHFCCCKVDKKFKLVQRQISSVHKALPSSKVMYPLTAGKSKIVPGQNFVLLFTSTVSYTCSTNSRYVIVQEAFA